MQSLSRKWIIIASALFVVLVVGVVLLISSQKDYKGTEFGEDEELLDKNLKPEVANGKNKVIGASVEGRAIEAYTFGAGATKILLVGGIHGGYEWNSVILAYKFVDYFEANPSAVPANLSVVIIPSLNPDGVFKIVGKEGRFTASDIPGGIDTAPGRFNANEVDLNRNFDCEWQPTSNWRSNIVSAGTSAFSEPEAKVLRDFVLANKFASVTFWHSQAGIVYASDCEAGTLPETLTLMNTYAKAAGYGAVEKFSAYKVTGDAEGWLAKIGIPSITVEFTTHDILEWEKNLAGVKALLAYYRGK
ncbi:hypothetical protein A2914_00205 [Candidatus Nomurabacteria bacterium RIFCSPLOWO2_01_FULL_41_21]|uniref:Peptidase M14 domain-containing protein n=2 Tax=Candidatus Nomuraibacteriota TaxID=1752729 RepID=A0A1F6V355_9BACT|nr:MAG: hypothetical protein A2733_02610 [Candidatus Nomurabacteria bacterium RIFCSPHIGHO2_01_FULL_40_20]OGI88779.1 MAG: hypothetical protein A2914_00205 [Candidatus Nomurabacteria bacterium RIFCSPLOWO2_01_FULL_41_21]